MPGAVLENLSGRKLAVLVGALMMCQIVCFLIGGLIAPAPTNVMSVLGQKCIDFNHKLDKDKWFYPRSADNQGCTVVEKFTDPIIQENQINANQIVFTFQLPLPRGGVQLDYSRWQQNLIGVLMPDIAYSEWNELKQDPVITLDLRMGYRDLGDGDGDWKLLASSVEQRKLDCSIDVKKEDYYYNCSMMPLFELGSLHHDMYLLNIRLPVDAMGTTNTELGQLVDLWLVVINQNGGFTKVWVSMKTVFLPVVLLIIAWFWRRVKLLPREPATLEYMLLCLGGAITLLNIPFEFLTLLFDMPFMLLLTDIRQGVFYAVLFSFWLVFAGEHLMDDVPRNSIRAYWKHLSAVVFGCLCLFIFDMCERGTQLKNPFYSIWVTETGANIALGFIILAGISVCLYFLFLSYMIWNVFKNISHKRTSLPSMSNLRRLHYEGIIYRFKFLMLFTLLCAALTVISFIIGQASEGRWKWDEDINLQYTSAFFTGVYGMWNIYVLALLGMYAPSHKRWPNDPTDSHMNSASGEEIEFSRLPTEPSESSSLSTYMRKPATE